MMSSRKIRVAMFLGVLFACGLARCAEPNEPGIELRFEDDEEIQPWIRNQGMEPGLGPIKPAYAAIFHLQNSSRRYPVSYPAILKVLKTDAGKSLSKKQQQFLTASDSMLLWGTEGNLPYHSTYILYAVSKDDAKKMVYAYLEDAIRDAADQVHRYETELNEYGEQVEKCKKEIPAKEAELEALSMEYEKVKEMTHHLSPDTDAAGQAKDTILEMNKVLDTLAIEIAGMEAKLSTVEEIKSQRKVSSSEGLAKLEEIKSEQAVELAGALARKMAALNIRQREEEFYNLFQKRQDIESQVAGLRRSLRDSERDRQIAEKKLANPDSDMIPPKLYQNKVTICPIE